MIVRGALQDDRPEQLAGRRRGQLVGADLVGRAGLLLRGEQQEAEQLLLDRRDRGEDPVDRQRVGRGEHRVGGDPALATRRGAGRRWRTSRTDRSSTPDTLWIVWR